MTLHQHRWRATAALTVAAVGIASVLTGVGAATAAPARTATTSTDTTYLVDTLGLPANTVVEALTYDRFQWTLQQPGQYAFIIGDPAQTPGFKAQAVAVDAAARAAGVSKVYWFNPNLSGSVTVGSNVIPNLDIRNPAGITTIAAASQTIYGYAWTSLVAQYLGNGLAATVTGKHSESAKVTTATDATVINDAVAPLYDYSAGTPAGVSNSTFFVYDQANKASGVADKLVSSVNLDTDLDYAAHVATAFAGGVAATIDQSTQFAFWKAEANAKHTEQAGTNTSIKDVPVLTDADNADTWRVNQITYPELVHLLSIKDSATKNFVILFGGTWCPNTRAVVKQVNAEAQDNDVTVYNFDTVLDGGTVGGTTTSATNPLQVRNTANNGTTANANPSFVYASVLSTYLKNIVTQYDLNNGSYVTFYPNGDTTKPTQTVRKLQVPFLINYQRGTASNPSSTAIKRQWIQQKTDASTGLPTFTEYMTQPWYTDRDFGRLGLSPATFPTALDIPGLASFNWKSPVYPDRNTNADASSYLEAGDVATLSAALAAVPSSSSLVTVADVTTAIGAANAATPVDATLVANLTAIKTVWTLEQTRKTAVTNALANLAFGLEAAAKVGTFFDGLPGGVTSTQTVTAPAVAFGVAPTATVAIANEFGRVPTGTVSLTVEGQTLTAGITDNAASFTLPVLAPGTHEFTVSYPGDDQLLAFTKAGSVTVAAQNVVVKSAVSSIVGAAVVKPTATAAGVYRVAVAAPAATGTVGLTLTNGSATTTVSGALVGGAAYLDVPALAPGTWSAAVSYTGDATYLAASTSSSIVVTKVAVAKIAGSVSTKPTTKKAGKYKVAVTATSGLSAASGKVTVKVKKGATTKALTGTLSKGVVTVTVPKLKKGTWTVSVSYAGDANYLAASAKGSITVSK